MYDKRSKSSYNNNKNNNEKSQQMITFLIISLENISIDVPYQISTNQIRNLIKSYGGFWNSQDKLWTVPRKSYQNIKVEIKKLVEDKNITVLDIPAFVQDAETNHQFDQIYLPEVKKTKRKSTSQQRFDQIPLKYSEIEKNIDPTQLPFFQKLYDFQKQTLFFGIKRHCRILLADEMGVGKTIQSLSLAYIYRYQWPLLIICPSSLRLNWQSEILNWYGNLINKNEVQVYSKGGMQIKQGLKLASKFVQVFNSIGFQVVIADQSHYLKNFGTKRTDILVPFLTSRKRIILLTGTPAFARPRQIYNLLSIIRPDIFGMGMQGFKSFGTRYCEPKYNIWSRSIQYNGCKNSKQLYYLIKDKIMLRRLKKQVLTQLPDKQRQKVIVQTDKAAIKQIKQIMGQRNQSVQSMILSAFIRSDQSKQTKQSRQSILEAYRLSGMAKIEGVKQYITELLQNDAKILIFAHHQKVLDEIENCIKSKNFGYIRIDGSVSQQQRQTRVEAFQSQQKIVAAILSITAAGVGLTLTASSTVVFAELHWTPGIMIQAEDRAHRIGQKNSVNCHYLIGENTLDQFLYDYLQRKVKTVSEFIDGECNKLNIEEIQKGEMGKYSKHQILQIREKSSNKKNKINVVIQQIKPTDHVQGSQYTEISSEDSPYQIGEKINIMQRKKISVQSKIDQMFNGKKNLASKPKIENDNDNDNQDHSHSETQTQRSQ